jgi:uncharacterized membrane protein
VLAALLIGLVVGLRTFTAPAVLLWVRDRGGFWAILISVGAIIEYFGDVHPKAPARTSPAGLVPRILAGAFCGWQLAAMHGGSTIGGAVLGAVGAVGGAYGGLALRKKAIDAIGLVPSGLLEDTIAIGLAYLIIAKA